MKQPCFTAAEKAECARRELQFRQRVYVGLVAKGRMNAAKAEREIAIMAEIAEDYRVSAASEEIFSTESLLWDRTS